MTIRIYLMPTIGAGTAHDAIRPKYQDLVLANTAESDVYAFGDEPQCIVVAYDIQAAGHTELAGQADVLALPANLDQVIGAQLGTVQTALDDRNIPSQWVADIHTYRQVLRVIIQVFRFWQRAQNFRAEGTVTPLFGGTVTLATRFNQLPVAVRTRLTNTADSLGFDRSGMTGAITIRQILKAMADQFGAIEMRIGGEVF